MSVFWAGGPAAPDVSMNKVNLSVAGATRAGLGHQMGVADGLPSLNLPHSPLWGRATSAQV